MKTEPRTSAGYHETGRREDNVQNYPNFKYQYGKYMGWRNNNSRNYHNNWRSPGNFKQTTGVHSNIYNCSRSQNLVNVKVEQSTSQSSGEAAPWSEEALEQERKQQVSDIANKLMDKLKKWSTEKDNRKECEGNTASEQSSHSSERGKKKHFQEAGQSLENPTEKKRKCYRICPEEVNKIIPHFMPMSESSLFNSTSESSVNKQKKIQENIIGELMTMPKENLNKVLVNPKINPKIERKMSQIVKENRLLLAQKFRNLAESKINSQGQSQFQTKFIVDVENLIDTDLAIDLCQLPPELIQKMGDIFQLDFEKTPESQGNISTMCEDRKSNNTNSFMNDSIITLERENDYEKVRIKEEKGNLETVENVGVQDQRAGKISVKDFANCSFSGQLNINQSSILGCNGFNCEVNTLEKSFPNNESFHINTLQRMFNTSDSITCLQSNTSKTEGSSIEDRRNSFSLENKVTNEKVSIEVQTEINLVELEHLLESEELPTEHTGLLIKEVIRIDDLIHVLNQRRFLLFAKLANLNSFKSSNGLKNKLMHAITNGEVIIKKNNKLTTVIPDVEETNTQNTRNSGIKETNAENTKKSCIMETNAENTKNSGIMETNAENKKNSGIKGTNKINKKNPGSRKNKIKTKKKNPGSKKTQKKKEKPKGKVEIIQQIPGQPHNYQSKR